MKTFKKILVILTLIIVFCFLGFKINKTNIENFINFQLISSVNSPHKTKAKIIYLKSKKKTPEYYLEYVSELDSLSIYEIKQYLETGYSILDTMHFPDSVVIQNKTINKQN